MSKAFVVQGSVGSSAYNYNEWNICIAQTKERAEELVSKLEQLATSDGSDDPELTEVKWICQIAGMDDDFQGVSFHYAELELV